MLVSDFKIDNILRYDSFAIFNKLPKELEFIVSGIQLLRFNLCFGLADRFACKFIDFECSENQQSTI